MFICKVEVSSLLASAFLQTAESIYHSTGCFSPNSTSRVIKNGPAFPVPREYVQELADSQYILNSYKHCGKPKGSFARRIVLVVNPFNMSDVLNSDRKQPFREGV